MCEPIEREIATKLAVDPRQQVEVELGRDAIAIVISGDQRRDIFLEIGADDRKTAGPDVAAHSLQKRQSFGRIEIADCRAGENATRCFAGTCAERSKSEVKSVAIG